MIEIPLASNELPAWMLSDFATKTLKGSIMGNWIFDTYEDALEQATASGGSIYLTERYRFVVGGEGFPPVESGWLHLTTVNVETHWPSQLGGAEEEEAEEEIEE